MNAPDGAESAKDREPDQGITLPSWIDAAIAKTRSDEAPAPADEASFEPEIVGEPAYTGPEADSDEAEYPTDQYEAADYESAESDDETYASEEAEDPSQRDQYGTPRSHLRLVEPAPEVGSEEEFAEDDAGQEGESYESAPAVSAGNEPFPSFLNRRPSLFLEPAPQPQPTQAAAPDAYAYDEIDEQRASIVTEALADSEPAVAAVPPAEPIPLPVAPIRRRPASGPWLMAAVFFAAAAIVLAVLIWLRPLPR